MIVPGSVNPLMLAMMGGDPLDEYGKILNSVRFNPPDAPYFWRQLPAGANRKKGAVSIWLKPSKIVTPTITADGNMHLLMAHNGTNAALAGMTAYSRIALVGDGSTGLNQIQMGSTGSAGEAFVSKSFNRDLSAHGHLYVRWDSTIPMLECYWNGAEISYTSRTLPTLNADTIIGLASSIMLLGAYSATQARYFDGYLSDPYVIIGSAPPVTNFGRVHPATKQWRPKRYSGTFGTHDSHMDFADGSAATSAALGKDRSGNNNDWTPVNISVAAGAGCDWTLDTPTNNYCVLNPLQPPLSGSSDTITRSNGSLTVTGSAYNYGHGTFGASSGKWYFEALLSSASTGAAIGIDFGFCTTYQGYPGFTSSSYGYASTGVKRNNAGSTAYGATYATNDVVGVAIDLDSGTLTFYKNGVSQGVAYSGLLGYALPHIGSQSGYGGAQWDVNFGQRAFAFSPPTDFKALCTKNLPIRYPVMKSESAFVAVTDTGANIAATLATARAGWSAYIDIIKRRDPTAEGWRWIFSDDAANYLDSSSTAAKAATPAFSGTAYVGYSLKVSAENGVATGRLTHASGVADIVPDGLANSRKIVILKNEATGNWFVYHPDLTAGKLLYLNLQNAETTDASINSVTASGFTAAAALASGTYRWISIAEVDGFSKIGYYENNASADGPFVNAGLSPAFGLIKYRIAGTTDWMTYDTARDPDNPNTAHLRANLNAAEVAGADLDFVSAGAKVRSVGATSNQINYTTGSERHCFVQFAGFPFRYANAR